ncbi:hypothetical protein LSH36_456g00003 [Paralvinella palmiformis]|uniref:Uncharacterized protein n=1 Tax=Paralvinella palmiformis TaxID=53620 RepID=A0AAD9JAW3_9ANNE|nr:hypothetical protein LSH36_456g00003 [Paralvinella palmiformis]
MNLYYYFYQAIVDLINEIASVHLSAAGHAIKQLIDHTAEELEFKLMKTSIPRPQELVLIEEDPSDEERDCFSTLAPLPKFGIGHSPPPRHKTKTPVSASRRPKSVAKDKPAKKDRSRGSSRSSIRSKAK